MEQIKVNPVSPKPSQASIAGGRRFPRVMQHYGDKLLCQERLIAPTCNRFADQFLSPAFAVQSQRYQ